MLYSFRRQIFFSLILVIPFFGNSSRELSYQSDDGCPASNSLGSYYKLATYNDKRPTTGPIVDDGEYSFHAMKIFRKDILF